MSPEMSGWREAHNDPQCLHRLVYQSGHLVKCKDCGKRAGKLPGDMTLKEWERVRAVLPKLLEKIKESSGEEI